MTRSPFLTPSVLRTFANLAHLAEKLAIGDRALVAGLPLPDERRLVPPRSVRVPVDAVDGRVQLAPHEPLGFRRLPIENLAPRREPFELFCETGPELFEVAIGLAVDGRVGDVRLAAERLGRGKPPLLQQQGFDRFFRGRRHRNTPLVTPPGRAVRADACYSPSRGVGNEDFVSLAQPGET